MSELVEQANMQLTPLQKVALLKERKNIIQKVMSDLMVKGEHYDIIPGTQKETLLKSGAELLTSVFNLAPKFQIQTKDFDNGHREYTIICELYSVDNGKFLGSGVGLCTSLETKYRYKGNTTEVTDLEIPENYWDRKKEGEKNLLPVGHKTEKVDGIWRIVRVLEKKENTDIADVYNTILKMGKKRALVDATLTVTGASDIFTQDTEDIIAEKDVTPKTEHKKENPKTSNKNESAPVEKNIIEKYFESLPKEMKLADRVASTLKWINENEEISIKQAAYDKLAAVWETRKGWYVQKEIIEKWEEVKNTIPKMDQAA